MARPYDVCILGTGIVGRTMALHLAAARLNVALVAQPAAPSGAAHSDVRAYALSPASRALLESVRCWPDADHATPVLAMEVQSLEAGRQAARVRFEAAGQNTQALNWIVDVPALENLLSEAVRFQPNIALHTEKQPAALTVISEGRASSTREAVGVEFDITPYHQTAIAARVECAMPHAQVARQWFANGEVLALLPMNGLEGKVCALVWSVGTERAKALQALSPAEFCTALQVASQGTPGELSLVSDRMSWVLQAARAQRWSGNWLQNGKPGSWVLAGDAAHTVHPLAGQGLNLGLGDVAELVQVLRARPYWRTVDDIKLLRAYERSRKAEHALVGGSGDLLQQLFNQSQPLVQGLRDRGMRAFDRSATLKNWIAGRAMGPVQKLETL
jgi:2-polyprenyl-6-methoxyphenol hydroxylase-like FAD-dependent oxidoreductase